MSYVYLHDLSQFYFEYTFLKFCGYVTTGTEISSKPGIKPSTPIHLRRDSVKTELRITLSTRRPVLTTTGYVISEQGKPRIS